MNDILESPIMKMLLKRQNTLNALAKTYHPYNPQARDLATGEILFLGKVTRAAARLILKQAND